MLALALEQHAMPRLHGAGCTSHRGAMSRVEPEAIAGGAARAFALSVEGGALVCFGQSFFYFLPSMSLAWCSGMHVAAWAAAAAMVVGGGWWWWVGEWGDYLVLAVARSRKAPGVCGRGGEETGRGQGRPCMATFSAIATGPRGSRCGSRGKEGCGQRPGYAWRALVGGQPGLAGWQKEQRRRKKETKGRASAAPGPGRLNGTRRAGRMAAMDGWMVDGWMGGWRIAGLGGR